MRMINPSLGTIMIHNMSMPAELACTVEIGVCTYDSAKLHDDSDELLFGYLLVTYVPLEFFDEREIGNTLMNDTWWKDQVGVIFVPNSLWLLVSIARSM
jgi:hypothetical protein